MIISVASGKGGTGKTTIAVNLALSLENVQLLDCDVEEPNAHLFIDPVFEKKESSYIPVPVIDETKCNYCCKCRDVCEYKAIFAVKTGEQTGTVMVFSNLCHGCGACAYFCPKKAIKEVEKEIGVVETGHKGSLLFSRGALNVSEAMSPPLIRDVKKKINPAKTVIIDAPPGTSCPVITAVKGSDYCILVTEPTPFGLNDLELAVQVLEKIGIPHGVVINRSDLGDDKAEKYCKAKNIPILMKIPFDKEIALLYSKGIPLVREKQEYLEKFREMFREINCRVKEIKEGA